MPPRIKSRKKRKPLKKAKAVIGFKIYRDASGRFTSKDFWETLLKNKRGVASVAVKRDAKGRFVSEKFLSSAVKIKKERVTVKPKVALKKKRKLPPCDYRRVFEAIVPGVTGHYNVSGVKRLSKKCLAELLELQLKKGAVRFRVWYTMPLITQSAQQSNGLVSTEPFWYTKLQGEGGAYGYLDRLLYKGYSVAYYWFRTIEYKSIPEMTDHGVLQYRSK